jgi:hypothetical protein
MENWKIDHAQHELKQSTMQPDIHQKRACTRFNQKMRQNPVNSNPTTPFYVLSLSLINHKDMQVKH